MRARPGRESDGSVGAYPRAALYRALRPRGGECVHEPREVLPLVPASERQLQCIWFDPALRPGNLRTAEGDSVSVLHPGIWNLEAGPDFLGADLQVGPEGRRLRGDIEVHIHPAGWRQHGHGSDPRYVNVRAHVTYFPGTVTDGSLPPGALEISLRDALQGAPELSLDAVDVAAYPYAARANVPPCSRVLAAWTADGRQALLDAAGEERLRQKTERLRRRMEEAGPGQALYEELLTALGFKHNKLPFRRLASALPLEVLREESHGDPFEAYALLAGVAGLIPCQMRRNWDGETRDFVRAVWDRWWKRKQAWATRCLDRSQWRLSGIRPANHPLRRLDAAGRLFAATPGLEEQWASDAAAAEAGPLGAVYAQLTDLPAPYWGRRLALGGKRQSQAVALLGAARIHSIIVNVFIPFAGARTASLPRGILTALPRDEDNEIVRRTAHFLFGPDHAPSLYRTGLRRQGLIQVFHDYCLIDRSRCATCALPEALRGYAEIHPRAER